MRSLPAAQGLYRPEFEHDACGVSFVVDMHGRKSHDIVARGIRALCNLEHRGASGAEKNTGDGAGILIQIPDAFLREEVDFELPEAGSYAVGTAFLPQDAGECAAAQETIAKLIEDEGLTLLGWRDVPFDDSMIGNAAKSVEPTFKQLFVGGDTGLS